MNRDRFQSFLLGMPFIGPEHRTHMLLAAQLQQRDETCLLAWGDACDRIRLARQVSGIIHKWLYWPNDFFIPEDPFEILVWDHTAYYSDGFVLSGIVKEFEEFIGETYTDTFWEAALSLRYGEVIDHLLNRDYPTIK